MNLCSWDRCDPWPLRGQSWEVWDLIGFWKLTEQFRGSWRETLDGRRSTWTRLWKKQHDHHPEDSAGLFLHQHVALIYCWAGGGLEVLIAAETRGGRVAALCRPVCLSVCLQPLISNVRVSAFLSQAEVCSLQPCINPDLSLFLMNARGKYWMLWKGRNVNRAKDGRTGLSWDICIRRWWKAFFMLLVRPFHGAARK